MSGSIATALFVLTRVAALVLIVPGLSQNVVSVRTRLLLIVLLTIPILCVIPPSHDGDLDVTSIPALLVHELVVGISLGLVPATIVWGLQVAVQALHGMTGLPGAAESRSLESSDAPIQRLFMMIVLVVFFLSSGHRLVLHSVLDSFSWLPAGSYTPLETVREIIVDMLATSFELGVRAMSPIAASLAFGLITLAAINRVVPQLEYFAVGMSVQTVLLMGALFLFTGGVIWLLQNGFINGPDSATLAWQQLLSNTQ